MKVLLIYPYFLDRRIHESEISVPPTGLYYVGAMLAHHGYPVEIFNWYDVDRRPDEIEAGLRNAAPDVVGFSILHANRWGGLDLAAAAKRLNPRVNIVFGGIGATFLWRHLLRHFAVVDYIVPGEGERTFLKLVQWLESRPAGADSPPLRGIAFRKNGVPVKNDPAAPISNLDDLPDPALYFRFQHVAFSRGCPGACTFCGSPDFWGRRVRAHSPRYAVDQLARLKKMGVQHFFFNDDTFTLDRERVAAICRDIWKRRLNITWVAISRVDAVNESVLTWMRKAGCTQISYGIESGAEVIRRRLGKSIRTARIEQAFAMTTRCGILPRAYFIYGSPGETLQTIEETIALMDRIKPLSAVFYILDLFPGTRLYQEVKRRHGFSDDIWLRRVEDILYFEMDATLRREQVLDFGRRLREAFHRRLPAYAASIVLNPDPDLNELHADFLSRLGMTFSHGDYAAIDAIPDKEVAAESLYRRALDRFPHPRAYLGLGMLHQRRRRFAASTAVLSEGRIRFPDDIDLAVCQGINHLNLNDPVRALECFAPHAADPRAAPYVAECRRRINSGRSGPSPLSAEYDHGPGP